jgi:hypothetical protein
LDPRLWAVGPREIVLPIVALAMLVVGAFNKPTGTASVALIVVGSGMFFVGMLLPALTEFEIGPSGFSATLRERDREIQETIDPHFEDLTRIAVLLAGSPEAGRELLDRALIETYLRWRQAKEDDPAAAVRRILGDLAPQAGSVAPPVSGDGP